MARDEHRGRTTHRRRGIATALLERLFEVTARDGRRGYTLEVRVSNEAAIRLYEKPRLQARGIRRGYYTDNREDALIMWRDPSFPTSSGRTSAHGERGEIVAEKAFARREPMPRMRFHSLIDSL